MDHRKELLRTQAVTACLNAMGAQMVNVHGMATNDWNGVILDTDSLISSVTHWMDGQGHKWRYTVSIRVEVNRRLVDDEL